MMRVMKHPLLFLLMAEYLLFIDGDMIANLPLRSLFRLSKNSLSFTLHNEIQRQCQQGVAALLLAISGDEK